MWIIHWATHVDDLGDEKLPFTMSLDSLQHSLPQETACASCFLADYHRQYFFYLLSFLSSPLKFALAI